MRHRPAPVTAIIVTLGERTTSLAAAVRSALWQRTDDGGPWPVEVLVVVDGPVHLSIEGLGLGPEDVAHGSSVRILTNDRTPGLAGGRNTGVVAAGNPVVGFLDDDDVWLPGKLAAQHLVWQRHPGAVAVGGAMILRTHHGAHLKTPPGRVDLTSLLRSRIHALHPSAMMFRRDDLLGPVGSADEELPHGYGEDYDLLLRSARVGTIRSTAVPVVRVSWDRRSYFDGRWDRIAAGLTHLLVTFPEFETDPVGLARVAGQVAFAHAAHGRTDRARSFARAALRRDPRQPRAWAALAVASGLVRADTLVAAVARTGHGL